MFDFIKKSTWSLTSVIIRSISTILVNKIFAVQYGPSGITLLAHFQNLISLITQIPNDGINRGIIKYWSGDELDNKQKHQLLVAGFLFNLFIFFALTVIIYVFSDFFLREFNLRNDLTSSMFFLFTGLLLFIVHLFLLSVILSFQKVKTYAFIHLVTSLVVLVVTYWVASNYAILYGLIAFIFAHASGLIISLWIAVKRRYISFHKASLPPDGFSKLGEFVLMACSVLIFGKLVDFIIRDFAINHFGLHQTGLWQSVVKISDSYMMLFINTVGIVYYPQVAAMIFDTEKLRIYLRDVLKIVIVISIVGLSFIFLFRKYVILILFDHSFLPAQVLMPFQLTGDFFCIISYLLTYIISAQARTRVFIGLQAGSALFYGMLVLGITHFMGIEGIPLAHAIRYVVLLSLLIYLNRRIIF